MHQLGSLVTTALAVVSIATLAGLGLLRGTVTNLREQLKDERDQSASLRQTRIDDKAEIARLKADVSALSRVVTGEAHLTALRDELADHHSKAEAHWARSEEFWERFWERGRE